MGKYAVVKDGKVMDITFRNKGSYGGGSVFYSLFVGETRLGTVTHMGLKWRGWDVYSHFGLDLSPDDPARETADRMRSVEGFLSRRLAGEYLIRHWGWWK